MALTNLPAQPGLRDPVTVLGTPLQVTTYEHLANYSLAARELPRTTAIEFANTQVVTMRRHDAHFRDVTQAFDWFVPDGMPLVWCMNRRGAALDDRVYGPTFFRLLVERSGTARHYLLGGTNETGELLRNAMQGWNPAAQVVGAYHGFCHPDGRLEDESVIQQMNALSPHFIWVALGTPKQQEWIHRYRPRLKRGLILSVGFAFDVNAGTKRDAPLWMQRRGLTWLFRLVTEPRRLGPRYLRYNTLFLWYLMKGNSSARDGYC